MKNLILLLLLTSALCIKAQSDFQTGSNVVTLGYGFPNMYKRLLTKDMQNTDKEFKRLAINSGSSFTYSVGGIGPVFLKYDYGVSDKVGIGIVIGYSNPRVTEKYSYKRTVYNPQTTGSQNSSFYQAITLSNKSLSFGFRLNYHFSEKSKVDPYIGFAIGYTHAVLEESFETNDPGVPSQKPIISSLVVPVYIGATFGVRSYITDNLGIYLEFGFDKWSLIQGGIALKLSK